MLTAAQRTVRARIGAFAQRAHHSGVEPAAWAREAARGKLDTAPVSTGRVGAFGAERVLAVRHTGRCGQQIVRRGARGPLPRACALCAEDARHVTQLRADLVCAQRIALRLAHHEVAVALACALGSEESPPVRPADDFKARSL
jgi:hypothetical protein